MDKERLLREAIVAMSREAAPWLRTGRVVAVDADTCDVEMDSGAVAFGVALRPPTEDYNITIFPAVGSQVVVARLTDDSGLVVASVAKADRVLIALSASISVELTQDVISLNGGAIGGLVVSPMLIARLNAVESLVNQAVNMLKIHTHPTGVGPSGPSAEAQALTTLTLTKPADIESKKIKV